MSLNLTGLADVAERSLQQIADDRRQTLDGAKHHAHVDVRLNELEESALSSLLMPMYARCRARPVARPVCHRIAPRHHHPAPTSSRDPAAASSRLASPQAACASAGHGGARRTDGG